MSYGMLWCLNDEEKGSYAAIGNSGNVIYVNPSNSFVAGVTSYFKPTVFDKIDFIREYLDGFSYVSLIMLFFYSPEATDIYHRNINLLFFGQNY